MRIKLMWVMVLALGVAAGAGAQTVVFSETFSVPDFANLNGNPTFDHPWNISSGGPGPDIVSGQLVSYTGVLWDSGVLTEPFSLDPGTEVISIEFDLTVNTIGTASDFFGVQIFDDTFFGGINLFLNTSAAVDDVTLDAFDNAIGFDTTSFGGPGGFVAGTSYEVTAVFQNGNSLDGAISIIATSGPGGDVLNNFPFSLNVDADQMAPIEGIGLVCSEGVTLDNLTITTGGSAVVPATNAWGQTALLAMVVLAAFGAARRLRMPRGA